MVVSRDFEHVELKFMRNAINVIEYQECVEFIIEAQFKDAVIMRMLENATNFDFIMLSVRYNIVENETFIRKAVISLLDAFSKKSFLRWRASLMQDFNPDITLLSSKYSDFYRVKNAVAYFDKQLDRVDNASLFVYDRLRTNNQIVLLFVRVAYCRKIHLEDEKSTWLKYIYNTKKTAWRIVFKEDKIACGNQQINFADVITERGFFRPFVVCAVNALTDGLLRIDTKFWDKIFLSYKHCEVLFVSALEAYQNKINELKRTNFPYTLTNNQIMFATIRPVESLLRKSYDPCDWLDAKTVTIPATPDLKGFTTDVDLAEIRKQRVVYFFTETLRKRGITFKAPDNLMVVIYRIVRQYAGDDVYIYTLANYDIFGATEFIADLWADALDTPTSIQLPKQDKATPQTATVAMRLDPRFRTITELYTALFCHMTFNWDDADRLVNMFLQAAFKATTADNFPIGLNTELSFYRYMGFVDLITRAANDAYKANYFRAVWYFSKRYGTKTIKINGVNNFPLVDHQTTAHDMVVFIQKQPPPRRNDFMNSYFSWFSLTSKDVHERVLDFDMLVFVYFIVHTMDEMTLLNLGGMYVHWYLNNSKKNKEKREMDELFFTVAKYTNNKGIKLSELVRLVKRKDVRNQDLGHWRGYINKLFKTVVYINGKSTNCILGNINEDEFPLMDELITNRQLSAVFFRDKATLHLTSTTVPSFECKSRSFRNRVL